MPEKRRSHPGSDPQPTADVIGALGRFDPFPIPVGEVALHHDLTVIEVAEAADLTALLTNPRLSPLVLARISETAALVLPDATPRLLTELKKAGQAAIVTGGR